MKIILKRGVGGNYNSNVLKDVIEMMNKHHSYIEIHETEYEIQEGFIGHQLEFTGR